MSIITFWNDSREQTGQTMATVAVATRMAIERNIKILLISTSVNDSTMRKCFWTQDNKKTTGLFNVKTSTVAIENGIDGLFKLATSNKLTPSIITDYTRVVFKERLDVLFSPKTTDLAEYTQIAQQYPDILQTANRCYDLVIVDLNKHMEPNAKRAILDNSDVVIMNLTQNLSAINQFMELREQDEFYRKKNIMIVMGKYDRFSKYNVKNVSKYLREKKEINAIPYCTLFFESCEEGTVVDYFLSIRKLSDDEDRNAVFVKEVEKMCNAVIYKLQELQMRM